ncbi:5'-methylthioadenosine/S-adenosylhomocysteine nucleosidase [Poriferisphaera corsica]|uniref:5'-methylthioadenosine/S-adenosylhomocysteine nucleosidase n=1 Tax=Poriferisphaera corsica TaxID=2528020 RepID=A0A517YUE6_9BACT|nr:hypothetical protein [Poriferisphaera corsica]QDU33807.1 5'-methylthioadenosine/S-adenosylhomocysteine nucleosidase [Poriferisphaera corsica]
MTEQPQNILLLTAMQPEMLPILKALNLTTRCINQTTPLNNLIHLTPAVIGVGQTHAFSNTSKLIEQHAPDLVLLLGISGALDPELETGDLLIPDSFINDHNDPVILRPAIEHLHFFPNLLKLDAITETIEYTADTIISTPESKLHVYEHKLAHAANMESYAVAKAARATSTPFLILRAIADTADDHLLSESADWINSSTGKQKTIAAVTHLLFHPTHLPDLLYMQKTFNLATQTLASAIKHLLKPA